MKDATLTKAWPALALAILVFAFGHAQNRVGETLVAWNEPLYKRVLPAVAEGTLRFQRPVNWRDLLETGKESALVVNLDDGKEVSMGPESKVELRTLEEAKLCKGEARVVTLGEELRLRTHPPDCRTGKETALAQVGNSSFIAACGGPWTDDARDCLFVGVYGATQVTSLAFPDQPVGLEPQLFSIVRPGQRPTAPERLPDARFLRLIDQTTAVGTGSGEDRIGIFDPVADGLQVRYAVPGPGHLLDAIPPIPVDPAPPPDLPQPPPPPARPEDQ